MGKKPKGDALDASPVDITTITGFDDSISSKWVYGTAALGGSVLIGAPNNVQDALLIYPDSQTYELLPLGAQKYYNGCLEARNNKVMCFGTDTVAIVDVVAKSVDTTTLTGFTGSSYEGAVRATNGKLYRTPSQSDNVMIISY